MRVGCDLPYFRDPIEIRDFAQGAEDLGFDHLGFSEHLAGTPAADYPGPIRADDPWHETFTGLAYLSAVTKRIELTSGMLLLALRPAVLAAKQAAEVDLLCGGRLRLGVSIGWNELECRALGVDPATRGGRLVETMEVMRRLWAEPEVTHQGRHLQLDRVGIHPRPDRRIPMWMGGGNFASRGAASDRTIRRMVGHADGYKLMAPTGIDPAVTADTIARTRAALADAGRDPATFGIEARLVAHATPPEEWAAYLAAFREAGASHVGIANRIAGGGVDEQLALVARIAAATRAEWGAAPDAC